MNESVPQPDWREKVKEKIELAKATALSVEETRKKNNEQILLQAQINKGEISGEEYRARYDLDERGKAYFKTLPEYLEALKILGLSKEKIDSILAHENEHRLVADQNGLDAYYMVILGRDGEDWDIMIPAVYTDHSNKGVENEIELSRKITEAPDDLSDGDKKVLGID
jgi:hypothetical protein